MMSDYPN
jgi:hypothetical protein